METITSGDRVLVHLGSRQGVPEGWYAGTVTRIDPYTDHRSFYWVQLEPEPAVLLGFQYISILNPRNIRKDVPSA